MNTVVGDPNRQVLKNQVSCLSLSCCCFLQTRWRKLWTVSRSFLCRRFI